MITDPVSAIKREVLQWIDLQIETLKQESVLDHSLLQDYQVAEYSATGIINLS
jgi:hypothetical protein